MEMEHSVEPTLDVNVPALNSSPITSGSESVNPDAILPTPQAQKMDLKKRKRPKMKISRDPSKPHARSKADLSNVAYNENELDIDPSLYSTGKEVKAEPKQVGKLKPWEVPNAQDKDLRDVGKLPPWETPKDQEKKLRDVGKLDPSRYLITFFLIPTVQIFKKASSKKCQE